jgi:peptidoglycan-associated lipoprotein
MKQTLSLAALAITVAACGTTEVKQPPGPQAAAPAAPAASAPASRTTPASATAVTANPLKDPKSLLSQRSVYFDFDDSGVKGQYDKLLQAHGRYLVDHQGVSLRLEGNCDERGSREYNLALGQRRAQSVKNVLKVMGVADARVETISYGEDKPMATGHDEAAWAKNRRADIKYPGE